MPRYDFNLDPINLERLAELPRILELDYRTSPKTLEEPHSLTTYHFVRITLFAIFAALALRIVSTLPSVVDIVLPLTMFTGLVLAALQYLRPAENELEGTVRSSRQTHIDAGKAFLFGPIALVAITLVRDADHVLQAFLLLGVLLVGVHHFLVRSIVSHTMGWVLANPALAPAQRDRIKSAWENPDTDDDVLAGAQRSYVRSRWSLIGCYGFAFAVVLFSVLAGSRVFAGMYGAFALLAALVFVSLRHAQASPQATLQHTRAALANFLTYNAHETAAPGVFRSPAGNASRRFRAFSASLALLALVLVPIASYFPLFGHFTPASVWVEAAAPVDAFGFLRGDPDPPPAPPSRADVRRSLSDEERAYYNRLDSSQQNAYLDAIIGARTPRPTSTAPSLGIARVRELAATPEGWLYMATKGTFRGHFVFLAALAISLALSVVVPVLVFFFTVSLTGGQLFVRLYEDYELADPNDLRDPESDYIDGSNPEWEGFVHRLQGDRRQVHAKDDSRARRVRDHLWLGKSVHNDYPILLHRDILHEHAWFLGNSGAGKTSPGLAPIITQIQRLAPKLLAEEILAGKRDRNAIPPSVIILDLKGEAYLYHGARLEAERAGVPFKWFSTRRGHSTYTFNPFLQSAMHSVTPEQKAAIILRSLGLEYGEGYGQSHYSAQHAAVIDRAFEQNPELASFAELHTILESPKLKLTTKQRQDAGDLFSLVRSLGRHEALNVVPPSMRPLRRSKGETDEELRARGRRLQRLHENRIDMTELVRCKPPQVLYFYMPASLEEATVRRIGRLILYALLTAAEEYELEEGHPTRVYAVIDEFQQIASRNLELFLRQARSKGVALLLSNQTTSDLIINRDDMRATVRANTRFKEYFAASDPELRKEIIDGSGDVFEPGWTLFDGEWVAGSREPGRTEPRITKNDILDMTDHRTRSIVHVAQGSDYTQYTGRPFIMESAYHITLTEKESRDEAPWPAGNDHTVSVGDRGQTDLGSSTSKGSPAETSAPPPEYEAGLRALRDSETKGENP